MWRILLFLLLVAGAAAEARDDTPTAVVALRGRDEGGLRALLARQQDPASPDFHRWLTPSEFGRRFGARGRDLRRASRWLRRRGCRVRRFTNRQLLACTGAHVDAVPPDLASQVVDLVGPDGPPLRLHLVDGGVHPLITRMGQFLFTPDEFALVYNLTPIRSAGIDGSGQRIGILGFTLIDPTDVDTFRAIFGLPPLDLLQVGRVRAPGLPV